MKNRLLFLMFLVLFGTFLFGQGKLKVTYEGNFIVEETNATSKFGGRVLPTDFELVIDGDKSAYDDIEKLVVQMEDDKPTSQMRSDHYFIDLKEKRFFVEQEIFGKKYLVSDSLLKYDWRIEKETKDILGHSVRKATTILEENVNGADIVMTAWYASKLPYAIGPELYGGLPGLILELEIVSVSAENAILTEQYTAKKIEILKDNFRIKFPKGKTISYEEAERIGDEHFDRIMEMHGGGVDKD